MKYELAKEFDKEIQDKLLEGEIEAETVFTCKYCNPNRGYESFADISTHLDECLMKSQNKSCATCKHLKIVEYAPYPKHLKKWVTEDMWWAMYQSQNKHPYCMKFEKWLEEKDYFDKEGHNECYEYSEDSVMYERDESYNEWWELSSKTDEELETIEEKHEENLSDESS